MVSPLPVLGAILIVLQHLFSYSDINLIDILNASAVSDPLCTAFNFPASSRYFYGLVTAHAGIDSVGFKSTGAGRDLTLEALLYEVRSCRVLSDLVNWSFGSSGGTPGNSNYLCVL